MNGKDIFLGLKYVGDDLIEKAEYGQFPASGEKREKTHDRIRRPFLLAALIALLLMLVGCGIVYVLHLQDLKIGEANEPDARRRACFPVKTHHRGSRLTSFRLTIQILPTS